MPAVEIKGRERPVTMNIDVHGTGLVSYGKHGGYRNLQGSTEDGGKVSLKEKNWESTMDMEMGQMDLASSQHDDVTGDIKMNKDKNGDAVALLVSKQ